MRWIAYTFLVTLAVLFTCPTIAKTSKWSGTDNTRVRLISESTAVSGNAARLGFHFQLDNNWKIYWRTPGDAGFPSRFDWTGSHNLASTKIIWPAPIRFSVFGLQTAGYKHEVVLPFIVKVKKPDTPLVLKVRLDFLACSDICIPVEANLSLTLPSGPVAKSPEAALITSYIDRVPDDGTKHAITLEPIAILKVGKSTLLHARAQSLTPFKMPDLFVESSEIISFGKPIVTLTENGHHAAFDVPINSLDPLKNSLDSAVLTLVDENRSVERAVKVIKDPVFSPTIDKTLPPSFVVMLALAFLGGLVLNLMPCVLPVLSIKLLSVISHGGKHKMQVRLGFLITTVGILTTLLGLAGILIFLKSIGATVGWGIQFQYPWFLISLILLVTLFACNLWGWFEIRLPNWIANVGATATHIHGFSGHFLTGTLVTLLATPCSAPFLGTAIGFALSRGSLEIISVFSALGFGLALPYLLVATIPNLATCLPKSGPWMFIFRKILGFAFAGTAIWLIAVLTSQIGVASAIMVGSIVASIIIILAMRRRCKSCYRILTGVVMILAVTAFLLPVEKTPDKITHLNNFWNPFDPLAIPRLVSQGKVVFVNVTADWCITCQLNELIVVKNKDVQTRLLSPNIIAMQADWTQPDDTIATYLASFKRYGIPFNVVYGPEMPDGYLLPELLTKNAIISALDNAIKLNIPAVSNKF